MAEYTINKIKFGNNTYNLSAGSVSLPIASDTTLGGIKVGSGLSINSTTGVLSATGGGTADSVDWQNVTSKPTTISGYGITDANISSGTITLGSNTITPLTAHQDISGKVDKSVTDDGTTTIIDNNGSTLELQHNTGNNEIANSYVWLSSTSADIGTSYTMVTANNAPNPSTGDNYINLSAANDSNSNNGVIVTPTQTIIKNIPTPTSNGDAANKKYVDDSVSGKANAATTIAGYGITDAKISNGTITLGSNTITPLTSETYQGTVTSVQVQATSPVNSSTSTAQSSTLNTTISLADAYGDTKNPYGSKTKNYVLAAPSNANGTPSFRKLVAADIPDLSGTYLTSETYTGTVTSVQVQATSPVQSSTSTAQSATLNTTISLADAYGDTKNPYGSKTAHYVLAAPSSEAGAPSFRALVAGDIPDLSSTYASKATTLAGYGITDAKIASGTITLGSDTITPLTSVPDLSGTYVVKNSTGAGGNVTGTINNSSGTITITSDNGTPNALTIGSTTSIHNLTTPSASGDAISKGYAESNFVTLSNVTEIAENTDLNTILTVGNYYIGETNSASITNTPYDGLSLSFELKVTKNLNTGSLLFQYLRYANGTKYKRVMNSDGTVNKNWYPENNEIHTLDEVNCSTSNTLAEVMAAMPRYSTLSMGWVGSGSGAQGSTTFGNDFPANYGRLYAIKATGNYPWFAWFYEYSTNGVVWLRVYDTVNATHDTGWNVVATRTLNSNFEVYNSKCTIGSAAYIKKYGSFVTAYLDITLSASTSSGSSNYFATVPSGYRPSGTIQFPAMSGTSNAVALCCITSGGNVYQASGSSLAASTRLRAVLSWSTV